MSYDPITSNIIGIESGGNPNAKNPRSSATGLGQFIDSTWLATVSKYRPDLVEGKSPQEVLALRNDPALSKEMVANYAQENGNYLTQNGQQVTPGTTYLAHFAGPQGAVKVLGSDPTAPVSSVLGPAVINANPFLRNMTAGDLKNWADRKMAGPSSAPQPSAPPLPPAKNVGSYPVAEAQAAPSPLSAQAPPMQAGLPAYGWSPQQGGAAPEAPQQQPLSPVQAPPTRPKKIDFSQLLASLPPRPSRRGFY